MNKQQLFKFLDKNFETNTLEEKVSFVREVLPNWLHEYYSVLVAGKKYCSGCKKYIQDTDFSYYEETTVETDSYHSDLLEVKRRSIYSKCPCCGKVVREKILSTDIVAWL